MSTTTTHTGYIDSTDDALLIFEACRLGILQRRTRRLCDSERRLITSGSIFVWDENESGIKRWTDGKRWSPSRVSGCFLVYNELEPKTSSSESATALDPVPKPGGLVKKALSLFTTENSKLHLVCYYRKEDADQGALLTPSRDSLLRDIVIPRSLYPDILPEMVHVLSATTATTQQLQRVRCQEQGRRMSLTHLSPALTSSPVTQLRSADRSPNIAQTQLPIPAHLINERGNGGCHRRRRDSLAAVPMRLVSAPTSRRCQSATATHDDEMLHRLDTASSKSVLGGNNTLQAFLPMQSRFAQQNTAQGFRSQSHPSPYNDDTNVLPSIGSSGRRYQLPAGSATAPSSRRQSIFNGDNVSNSGTETSLPSISEMLSSISSSPPPLPGQGGAGIQSTPTTIHPLPKTIHSEKARARYMIAPWSKGLHSYTMASTHTSPLVHDSNSLY
ncbi:Gluconate transport-inducing protein [Coemansia aciculifera]|nr:Gluconate transport-inducing protein [Coemansia aciculifera]